MTRAATARLGATTTRRPGRDVVSPDIHKVRPRQGKCRGLVKRALRKGIQERAQSLCCGFRRRCKQKFGVTQSSVIGCRERWPHLQRKRRAAGRSQSDRNRRVAVDGRPWLERRAASRGTGRSPPAATKNPPLRRRPWEPATPESRPPPLRRPDVRAFPRGWRG
jgi:hypothetical protein